MFKEISITIQDKVLSGHLYKPLSMIKAWIIFSHGSGSSHLSPRNNKVAKKLLEHNFGVLLFDLLTEEEDSVLENRFNISLLTERLLDATSWLLHEPYFEENTPIGYFGASTGAASALRAASLAPLGWPIYSVVSRGGRPDLAGTGFLRKVKIPTLLIVGDKDYEVIKLNMVAQNEVENSELVLIPRAGHLFDGPGEMEKVTEESLHWFENHLPPLLGNSRESVIQ